MRISTTAACVVGALWAASPLTAQQPRGVPAERPDTARQSAGSPRREQAQGPWTSAPYSRTLPIGTRNTVELSQTSGSVTVTGVRNSSSVVISANRRIMMQNRDAAAAMLQRVMPQITQRGGGIEILTGLPDGVRAPILVDYEISLPNTAAVSIRSWGGDIRVSNVGGELRLDLNGNGDIAITNAKRVRRAKAIDGMVTVTGMDGDELNAETLRGNLQVKNVSAQSMELKSVSGAISVVNSGCDRCAISSLSGNVEMLGPLRPDARLTVNTNTGNIRLVPAGNIRFDLEAITTGTKQSDFPLQSRATELRMLRGSYGEAEGSTIISLSSFAGNITVAKQ